MRVGSGRDEVRAAGTRAAARSTVTGAQRAWAAPGPDLLALGPTEQTIAYAAAVAGDGADPALLAAVADLAHDDAYRALDGLTEGDVLRPEAYGPGFRFRHPAVREAAYAQAPAGWRLSAHARADRVLRERGASARARAPHLARCATPGDGEAVTVLRRAAGDVLYEAPADAADWLTVALRLLPDDAETGAVLRDCAHARALAGDLVTSRRHLHRLLSTTDRVDPAHRVGLAVLAARTERLLGRHAEADALLRAEVRDRTPDDPHRVDLAVSLAAGALLRGDTAAAGGWASEVVRRPRDTAQRIGAVSLAVLAGVPGVDVQEAAAAFDALLDPDLAGLLDPGSWLPEAELAADRLDDARRHTDRMLIAARDAGRHDVLASLGGLDARLLVLTGDLAGADVAVDRAEAAARRSGSPVRLAEATTARVWAYLWQGDAAAAARTVASARERDVLAAAWLTGGSPVTGRAPATAGRTATAGHPLPRVRWLDLIAARAARRGEMSTAVDCAEQARRLAESVPTHRMRGYAALAATHGLLPTDPAAAAAGARQAVQLLTEVGDRLGAAHARRRVAAALVADGDSDGARRELGGRGGHSRSAVRRRSRRRCCARNNGWLRSVCPGSPRSRPGRPRWSPWWPRG